MVNSYKTLLADGSISATGLPQSANSRKRIDTAGVSVAEGSNVKVYSNNLFCDGGDILAAETTAPASTGVLPASPSTLAGSQKFQQQRHMAAQKRLERLQLGGVAQSNDGAVAVVQLNSKPSAHGSAKPISLAGSINSFSTSSAAQQMLSGLGSFANTSAGHTSAGEISAVPNPATQSEQRASGGMRPSSATERNLIAKGLATVYDPTQDIEARVEEELLAVVKPGIVSAGGSAKKLQPVPAARLDLSDMAAFLVRPGPRTGPVLCYIERDKGSVAKSPCYRMHMDDGQGRTFLIAARKRVKTTSSNYIISSSTDDLSRSSSSYLGKLRSNFVGTEFSIHCKSTVLANAATKNSLAVSSSARQHSSSGGRESKDGDSIGPGAEPVMQEVGAVVFGFNVLGTRGPRKMTAAVPGILSADGNHRWRSTGSDDTILDRLKNNACGDQITVLRNKSPKWNDALNAYCLNFGGRVTEASVKNFQLVTDSDPDTVVLQFGKVSDSCFTCDFMWPLSPLQAFCVCLSSFDNKLACE